MPGDDNARLVPAPVAGTRRVSVRRRLPASAGGGAGDVVGHVIGETPDALVLLPEGEGPVVVPREAITALREVPEQVVRPASSADRLERLLDRTWPGVDRYRLGGWVLRASEGVTMRANSVLVTGDPGVGLDRALDIAAGFYAKRGRPSALQVVLDDAGAPTGLSPASGPWAMKNAAHVLVADLRRADLPPTPGDRRFAEKPGDAWWALWRGGRATPQARSEVESAPATYLTTGDGRGATVAVGRVALAADWCVLSCLEVASGHRGEGLGRAATIAMLEHARTRGARFASLQVAVDDTPASRLYESLGFTRHHTYAYAVAA